MIDRATNWKDAKGLPTKGSAHAINTIRQWSNPHENFKLAYTDESPELEAALKSKEKDMTALIANKKFAEASALQEEIDALSEKIKSETAT